MSIRIDFLDPDYYYHIFNRGITSSPIFKEEKNYDYFMKKFSQYILEIANELLLLNPYSIKTALVLLFMSHVVDSSCHTACKTF